jgi:hypothetical protein
MDPEFGLKVGVMLGAGGLWMLQNRGDAPEQDELHERVALLERIAASSAGRTPALTRDNGRMR